MTRTTIVRGGLIAAGALATTLVAGSAAQAHDSQREPEHRMPGMERMHELHMQDNPGMERMHELHMQDNPGMQRMHERHMQGDHEMRGPGSRGR
jgi:hypothetical protein